MLKNYISRCFAVCFLGHCVYNTAFAIDEDTRLLQEQSRFSQYQQEQKIVEKAQFPNEKQSSYLNIDGQNFLVNDTDEDLTRAIFISINRQQWLDVQNFLWRYKQLEPHAEVVVLFAEGTLARAQGKLKLAEQKFEQMIKLDDEFSRGKLEFARILFENKKDKESKLVFEQIYMEMPIDIQNSIKAYLQAIQYRNGWRSSIATGLTYNTNINQQSGNAKCYGGTIVYDGDEYCLNMRKSSEAISDWGWNFNASLNKKISLKEQHNVVFKGLLYGVEYDTEHEYSNETLNASIGYNFSDARHDFYIAPVYEKYILGYESLYDSYGLRLEYSYILNNKNMLNIQVDYQDNHFNSRELASYYNGDLYSAYLTWNHQISPTIIIFSGINYAKKDIYDQSNSFDQWGGRLGFYKSFDNGSNISLLGLYRKTDYKEENLFLDTITAKNGERIFMVNYNMPNYSYKDIYPSINYKYSKLKSNIDWFYDYSGSEFSFKLQKNF